MDELLRAEVLAIARECVRRELPELTKGAFAGMKEELLRDMEKLLAISKKCTEKVALAQGERSGSSKRPQDAQLWYRNISYGDDAARASKPERLAVYDEPDRSRAPRTNTPSLFFGDMLPVKKEHVLPNRELWLQLGQGARASGMALENKWVLAESPDPDGQTTTRHCAKLSGLERKGRPQPEEYAGQDFGRMFTEGYDGHQEVTLLSASGQAFWKPINISCLLRSIATSTVFEKGWTNSLDAFDAWVPHYAVNVYRYGLAGRQKALCVTVKPTADWRRYSGPDGVPSGLDEVAKDLGRAQQAECKWMLGAFQKLGFQWSDVRFFTAQSFLKRYGHWTAEDCASEALQQLDSVAKGFSKLDLEAMHSDLFAQIFCLEEAFDCSGRDLQEYLQIPKSDRLRSRLSGCSLPQHPGQRELTDAELQPLWAMCELWMKRKREREGVLTKFGLSSTSDADVLICRHALHLVAAEGHAEVATAMLATLHASAHRTSCLQRLHPSGDGQTPLHVAAKTGHVDVLRVFIKGAVDCQQLPQLLLLQDSRLRTALGLAKGREALELLTKEVRKLAASRLKSAGLLSGGLAAAAMELKTAGFTARELRAAGFGSVHQAQPPSPSSKLTLGHFWSAGYAASDLKGVDVSARELWQAGYSASSLKAAGFLDDEVLAAGNRNSPASSPEGRSSVQELREAGYPDERIRGAGYTITDFQEARCSVQEIRAAGYTFQDFRDFGCSGQKIREAGYAIKDFQEAGLSKKEIRQAGYSVKDFRAAGDRFSGYTVKDFREVGYCDDEIREGGFTVVDFWDAGYSDQEIREAGHTVKDFQEAGCSEKDIKEAGFTVNDFRAADDRFKSYTVKDFRDLGYSDREIREAGYTVKDCRGIGDSWRSIREAGYEVKDFRKAGCLTKEIREAGYPIMDFRKAGCSDKEILDAGFSLGELFACKFSPGRNK